MLCRAVFCYPRLISAVWMFFCLHAHGFIFGLLGFVLGCMCPLDFFYVLSLTGCMDELICDRSCDLLR
jgi:hypothetical protein